MEITERGLASPESSYQVVNYGTVEIVSMHGGAGDDKFISDDASKQFDIFGDAGNDSSCRVGPVHRDRPGRGRSDRG